jgi:hypothetical protein
MNILTRQPAIYVFLFLEKVWALWALWAQALIINNLCGAYKKSMGAYGGMGGEARGFPLN